MNKSVTRPGHMVPGWSLSPSEAELARMEAEGVFHAEDVANTRLGVAAACCLAASLVAGAIWLGVVTKPTEPAPVCLWHGVAPVSHVL